ncbi:uncharacterized protein LOC116917570 [Daphnia magna]|nr:uncharacterized protein LOC116917570 [Daphnia magna]XP_032778978.2 uncharacterized protein LOC116917570 [Daphnia magna]XP_045026091.1 uncharacterized protein LOC116917570 [Daphnia magna]
MAILRRCCCCFPLRGGTVTLGVMGFTGAITVIIYLILSLIYVDEIATFVMEKIIDFPRAFGTRHVPKEDQDKMKEELHEILVHVYRIYVFVLAIPGEILGGILAGLLVWGAVKKRRNFLLPWLIYAIMVMVVTVVCIITCVVILPVSYGITFLIIGVLELLVMIYFWLVVFSFFQQLRENDQMNINSPAEMKRLTSHV